MPKSEVRAQNEERASAIAARASAYVHRASAFLQLIRFSHTIFALPFALLAALMAWSYEPGAAWGARQLVGIVLCMVFARSTAMAFNRLVDRRLDALNPRTAGRHLPAGLLSVGAVRMFALLSAATFVASTLLFLPNRWPLYLSVPVLLFVCGYSFAKRFTAVAHFWLGAALSLAPIAVWIALLGRVDAPAVVLAAAVAFWVAGFDIVYACQDYEVDARLGLHSVPAKLG
ncbi:MAG TPA: 4-hydroxybenzoate octaprenyltransferase, partial [Pirellulales bacterium]|nr:4-hydroxybenzoate octaprenyltransferase [Pirellulales bacterium]